MNLNIGFTDHGLRRLRKRAQVPEGYEYSYVQKVIDNGECWSDFKDNCEKFYYNGLFIVVATDEEEYDYLVVTCFFEESEYNEEVKA